jgi:transposase InsO family protein
VRLEDEKWALFWCKLIEPIIFGEIEKKSINKYLKKVSETKHLYPDGKLKYPSISSLRRKLNKYLKGGFNHLFRKRRNDIGKIRSVDQEILDKAIELKKDQPKRSDDTINRFLKVEYDKTIAKSTLYRHLKLAGATKLKLGVITKKVRKRWTRDYSNDLWIGDFEDGPYVIYNNEVVPTYLSLFIDCHSRYIVEGRYYYRQNLDILIDSLIRAWSIHGTSKELYLDNAKVYHSNRLKAACYDIPIKLIHRAKGDPSPGGLVERFFGTSQSQFEAEVKAGDLITLDELNKSFSAYLEVVYHPNINSETNEAPEERYKNGLTVIRHIDLDQALKFFMEREQRTVNKDFSDIRIHNRFYRVDPKYRGDKVIVRYDSFSSMDKVFLYSLPPHEQYLCEGILYNRDKGADSEIYNSKAKPKYNYLELLKNEHEKIINAQTKGIDYKKIISQRDWPFLAFTNKLAQLLGIKLGISTFSTNEHEMLKKTYNSISNLNETMLIQAFEKASSKTVPHIIYQLQLLKYSKGE